MKSKNNSAVALSKITASMAIFGTIGIFVRHIGLPSGSIAFVRGVLGTVFLLIVMLIGKKKLCAESIKKNLIKLVLSGVFIGINWILLFEAYNYTTVACATVCYYLSPVFVMLASPLVLGEKLTLKKTVCILTALLGVVLVSGIFTEGIGKITGVLMGIGAAVLYATVVLINKHMKDIGSYDMTVVQLACAALTILPYTLIAETMDPAAFTAKAIVMLLIVGTVHTGLAYVMYFGAVKELPAQTAAIFSYIDPAIAIILSALILREPIDALGIIGAVLVLGSTLVCELPARK